MLGLSERRLPASLATPRLEKHDSGNRRDKAWWADRLTKARPESFGPTVRRVSPHRSDAGSARELRPQDTSSQTT